jgi:hypothetical protein
MPFTGQGGQFGGPQYGWGDVPGAGGRNNANSGLNRGRYTNSPEAGLHRGEWQWRGHAPDAQRSYGWDYQGGVGRDEITQRTEARMGSSFQARMAQERSGGLPQGRYAIEYDRGQRTGGGSQDVHYDWGWQGHTGGMDRYGSDYRGGMQGGGMDRGYGASGGYTLGGGHRQARGGYGSDFGGGYGASGHTLGSGGRTGRGGYGQDFGGSGGAQFGGGYGAERGGYGGQQYGGGSYGSGHAARGYDRGMGGGRGPYSQPLSDAEFYRRVERW